MCHVKYSPGAFPLIRIPKSLCLTNPSPQLRLPVSPLCLGTHTAFPCLIPKPAHMSQPLVSLGPPEWPKNQTDATMTRSGCCLPRECLRDPCSHGLTPTNGATVTHKDHELAAEKTVWPKRLVKLQSPALLCRAAGLPHWVIPEHSSCSGPLLWHS